MSWNAEGFDKPLILLEYETVQETIEKNAYKPEEDIAPLITQEMSSQDFIHLLAGNGKFKEACDFLSSCIHRRAGIWWGYQCIRNMKKEIDEAKPELEKNKEEDKKKKQDLLKVDDSARQEAKQKMADSKAKLDALENEMKTKTFTDPNNPKTALQEQLLANVNDPAVDSFIADANKQLTSLSPELKAQVEKNLAQTKENYRIKYGMTLEEGIRQAVFGDLMPKTPHKSNLMDQEEAKLKAKMDELKTFIKEKMSVFPLKIPGLPKPISQKRIDDALEAAVRWVMAPTDINAKLAMEAGRGTSKKPEGLIALSAFWSGNNLLPGTKQLVVPPPGLAPKGVSSTIFMCAMAKDGKKSYDERYQKYYHIGIDVADGANTWDKEVYKNVAKTKEEHDWEGKSGFGRTEENLEF